MTHLDHISVVVITGSIGAGKTTTQELGHVLSASDIPHTVIDMDWLRDTHPQPADDPFNERLGYRNLADVVRNSREAGSSHIAIADVVESREQCDRYREAIPGAEVTVVRLIAEMGIIRQRIAHRGRGSEQSWELHRAVELEEIMDAADVADITIDTTDRKPYDVAREIAERLGWVFGNDQREKTGSL